jgi:DNA-binding transcriptional LysR family regulator
VLDAATLFKIGICGVAKAKAPRCRISSTCAKNGRMGGRSDILRGVMAVLAVARAGSFRGAMRGGGTGFRRLYNDVKMVEDTLGVLVFHRTADGVVLTPEGRAIVDQANRIEDTVNEILRLGRSMGAHHEGEVMLATTEGLGTFWVAPRLSEFRRRHGNISLSLHPSMSLVDMRRFEIDLALQVVEPILPDIRRTRIGSLHMMLTASPGYIERHGMPKTPEELEKHHFVFHTSPQSNDRQIIERAMGRQLHRDQFIVLRNSSAHYMTIEHGEGIGFLPTYGFAVGAKTVPIDLPIRYAMDIWLCFHEHARSVGRVSTVIDWLIASFDPRLYPWFRREFVPPKRFAEIVEAQGLTSELAQLGFNR